MRRSQIWKISEQIAVRRHAISLYFSICENREEVIEGAISERPPIVRVRCRTGVVIAHDVWQQRLCDALRFLRGVTARMLQ
jgi:hypothetical protein